MWPMGVCVWFTGLSGSGKSTTASALCELLQLKGHTVTVLDGDIVRMLLSSDLGFSKRERDSNARRIAFVAGTIVRHRGIALCSVISPYRSTRAACRQLVEPGRFVEVFVNTPLAICESRDPKGLYAKARRGQLAHLTGVDDPYEPPISPDLTIDTIGRTARQNAATVFHYVQSAFGIQASA